MPIHAAVTADGRHLLCANWGDGSVAVLPLDAGSTGPRHLVVHWSGRRYVADEQSSSLSTYVPDPATGGLRKVHEQPATLEPPAGPNHPSEIALSADCRLVYLANRGNDAISTFEVDGGVPVPVDEAPTGGVFPRHFAVAGSSLYVANEHSHSLTVLRLDEGRPRPTGVSHETPSPTCVLPSP